MRKVFYAIFFLLITGLCAYPVFFFKEIKEPALLPEFHLPSQEDIWNFNNKLKAISNEEQNPKLILSLAELNYHANVFSYKPAYGFYIDKIRFASKDNQLKCFLLASGFTLRSLIFSFSIGSEKEQFVLNNFTINNKRLSPSSPIYKYFLKALKQISNQHPDSLLAKILSDKLLISFENNLITITNSD